MKIKYPQASVVSVWVGTFASENDFDRCIDEQVTPKLQLDAPIESICEIDFYPEPTEIRKLLEGFSGWETFIEEAVEAAGLHSCASANAALVCYYVKCEEAPNSWGDLQFLGSFEGRDS